MTDDRVEWHLANFGYWQRERGRSEQDDPDRGVYSSRASGGIGVSHRSNFDSMVDAVDRRCADAVEAILWNDCSIAERNVVLHKHVASVYRFPRLGFILEQEYESAKKKVGAGLDRRGIV